MGEFSTGSALSRAMGIWFRRFVPFTVISLICFAPDFAFTYYAVHDGLKMSVGTFTFIGTALQLLLGMVATSAITYGVVKELQGQRVSTGESLSVGLGRIFTVLGTSILVGLAVGIGLVLLIIPGVIAATALFVAVPAAVVERLGGFSAVQRSTELTKGHRGGIFGVAVLIGVVNFGANKILQLVMEGDIKSGGFTIGRATFYVMFFVAIAALLAPMSSSASAVVYHDLRRAKEGIDVAALAAVFD